MSIYKLPLDVKKSRQSKRDMVADFEENDFSVEDRIGYILMPLDFIPRLIGWSMGTIDEHDESLQLSWIMRNFARQFIDNYFNLSIAISNFFHVFLENQP